MQYSDYFQKFMKNTFQTYTAVGWILQVILTVKYDNFFNFFKK